MRRTVLLSLLVLGGCFGTKTPPEPAVSDGGTSGSSATAPSEGAVAPVLPAALTEEQKAIARREKAKEATALLTTGKFEDARRAQSLLEELKAELPESAELAYNLGLAHEQLGNRAMAEQAYRSATQLDPELGAAWLKLGSLAEGNGDPSWALTVYGQGMRAAPTDMDLHVARIGVLVRQGRLADAEAAAKEALAINANAQSIYSNLALIYIKQGKLELGKFIINRAFAKVDGAENNAHLHAYLGRIFYLEDHPFAARDAYEKALELDPELLDAMLFLSEVHLDNRAYGAMVPLLEKAVAVDPDDPAIHMNLGIGYRGLGRFEEAEQEYRKVIELLPGRSEPYLNLVILYGDHQKKYDEAMQLLEQYKGMAGADPAIAEAWALQYEKEKEKAARLEARRQRAEERRKKREEEQRFLEEFERKKKEEEERQRQLEAQQAAEAAEAAAAGGTAAPVGTEAPPPAGNEPAPAEPVEPAAGGEVAPAGTDAAQPVSEPVDSTSAPAAPSEPAPGASSEDAAGQTGEGDASEPQPAPSPENPWGG
jgi:Flp pilus assembly protein TadD